VCYAARKSSELMGSPINPYSHALGVHEEYPLVLRAIDEAIGNYVEAVHSSKKYKSYSFAVISDHVSVYIVCSLSKNDFYLF